MLKAYKTEIAPTEEQAEKIRQTIGVARYVKNMYITHNQEVYRNGGSFISGMVFSKWLNNEYLPNHPEKSWIRDVYAKSTKQSILDTEKAFKRFFKGLSGFPKLAKKNKQDTKMYFVGNDRNMVIACERHRIKVPTLGWVKLKEKGYIPSHDEAHFIKSGTISQQGDRYYISVLVEEKESLEVSQNGSNDICAEGIGIDLGIKEFAVLSNGVVCKNINKTARIRKLEKQLKRQQRKLSRKYESEKKLLESKNIKKGKATRKNIKKQVLKVQRLHKRLADIRGNRQDQIVAELVKTKPAYITIEDLNVKGMMKNRHLSKAVKDQSFYHFRTKLEWKCKEKGIELRLADRFYPSSKRCHKCGHKNMELRLSDRIFHCKECGYTADRDFNASLNLRDAKEYKVIA